MTGTPAKHIKLVNIILADYMVYIILADLWFILYYRKKCKCIFQHLI